MMPINSIPQAMQHSIAAKPYCVFTGIPCTRCRQQSLVSLREFFPQICRPDVRRMHQTCHATEDGEDLEFAVFRFTLGIPGFDDDNIPRVVGFLGAILLAANRFAAGGAITQALARAEVLGALIAAICIATPTVQTWLKEMQPGRINAVGNAGSGGAFLLAEGLSDDQRKELAWASYALLRNTNANGVMLWHDGNVLMARGSLGTSAASQESAAAIAQLSEAGSDLAAATLQLSATMAQPVYLADAARICSVVGDDRSFVPRSAQSLVASVAAADGGTSGILFLFSDQVRGLSQRQRSWAAAIAAKLGQSCLRKGA